MLIEASRSILLLIDLQTKLAPAIHDVQACIAQCRLLIKAARRLDVPILASEHYPQGLGPTVDPVRELLRRDEIVEKIHFDGSAEPRFHRAITAVERPTVVIGGAEAHVCVLQTALGLKDKGLAPVIVADAVSSRTGRSRDLAIARMRDHGVDIVTAEMVAFEWLRVAGTAAFKDLIPLISER